MDIGTLLGILVGLGGILLGNFIEGGKLSQIAQPTAAMIVLGGTTGATMIQFPFATFVQAVKNIKIVFKPPTHESSALLEEIIRYATTARKEGILALEPLVANASDPFLGKALSMAVDGADSAAMREMLEASIGQTEEQGEDVAKVFEAMGGYAPTVGIIGAVLGLIQVMQNLSDITKVGEGIAVAFVATIYGVGIANIVALPMAGKLKMRTREEVHLKLLMLEGALAIQQGMNPKLVRERLLVFMPHGGGHGAKAGGADAGEAAA